MISLPLSNGLSISKGVKAFKKKKNAKAGIVWTRERMNGRSMPGILVGGTKELFWWCETFRQHLFLSLDEFNWIVNILWWACAFLLCNFNIAHYEWHQRILFSLWWFKSASQDETTDIIKGRKYRQEGVKGEARLIAN